MEFRQALADVQAEMFPDWIDEQLIVTTDEAGDCSQAVKKRLGCPKAHRPFLLTALIGIRKNKPNLKANP